MSSPTPLSLGPHRITILPAGPADIPACVTVFNAAFASDPLFIGMAGTADRDLLFNIAVERWKKDWERPGIRVFKAVDEATGEIAALAKWNFPHTLTPEEKEAEEAALAAPRPDIPGYNRELTEEFLGALEVHRRKWVVREEMYFMALLAVSPTYQRIGLGAALLRPVLEQADKEGRKAYIEASPVGVGLYRKFGWRECDEPIRIDVGRFEGYEELGTVENLLMMREPGSGLGV